MKKTFKNSFAVAGTQAQLKAFKEWAESVGWLFQQRENTEHHPQMWFEGQDGAAFEYPNGSFWKCVSGSPNTVFSLPSQWSEAMAAAQEVVEEPKIAKCVTGVHRNGWIRHSTLDSADLFMSVYEGFDAVAFIELTLTDGLPTSVKLIHPDPVTIYPSNQINRQSMKREIKFRAYNPKTKTMICSDELDLPTFFKALQLAPDADVMQYTGFGDKDGKDIYEDDILECSRYDNNELHMVIVKDVRDMPREMFGSNLNYRRVIGNIHENPELLTPWPCTPLN